METLAEDIKDSLSFLAQFDWIHNFQVTNIFAEDVLKNIPVEWLTHLRSLSTEEINELPFLGDSSKEMYPHWSSSLHNFICRASALSLDKTQATDIASTVVDADMARGMSSKKQHEVSWMASLVNNVVRRTNCNLIVDVGSGIGYLDHVLHQVYGYPVVGLEISESHISAAELRAISQGLTCAGIKSLKFEITNDEKCFQNLETVIHNLALQCCHSTIGNQEPDQTNYSSSPKVCLIGLHCCGDLSSSVLSLFQSVTCIKAVCYVCCCYHKITFTDDTFPKFPISLAGQKHYQDVQDDVPSWQFTPFTLRVGAQETRCRWRTQNSNMHADHVRHVAYRGLLELIDFEDTVTVRKRVRKCDFSSFETFLETYFSACKISTEMKVFLSSALREHYEQHKNVFDAIEIITLLQVILQPVIESLIYKDRVQWLIERGCTDIEVIPIFDELKSPRNLAIVAVKPG